MSLSTPPPPPGLVGTELEPHRSVADLLLFPSVILLVKTYVCVFGRQGRRPSARPCGRGLRPASAVPGRLRSSSPTTGYSLLSRKYDWACGVLAPGSSPSSSPPFSSFLWPPSGCVGARGARGAPGSLACLLPALPLAARPPYLARDSHRGKPVRRSASQLGAAGGLAAGTCPARSGPGPSGVQGGAALEERISSRAGAPVARSAWGDTRGLSPTPGRGSRQPGASQPGADMGQVWLFIRVFSEMRLGRPLGRVPWGPETGRFLSSLQGRLPRFPVGPGRDAMALPDGPGGRHDVRP